MFIVQALLLLVVWGVWWYTSDKRKHAKYPPGPPRLPILGNLYQIMSLSDYPAMAFKKLAKIYGDIMFVKMGTIEAVVFSGPDNIREMLVHEKTVGRYQFEFAKDRHFQRNLGIVWGTEKPWQNLRRFTLRNLREFGFGKSGQMEVLANEEFDKFAVAFQKEVDHAPGNILRMEEQLNLTILNVLWRMVSGKSYDYDDPKMLRLLQLNRDWMQSVNMGCNFWEAFPFLRNLLPNVSGKNSQFEATQALYDYGKELLDEQRKEVEKYTRESFIDMFAAKVEEAKGDPNSDFTDDQFVITVLDLLVAGAETTSNTIMFGILYLLLNPDVQEKIQDEIDKVVPANTAVDWDMKPKLPYTSAAILETLRYSTVIPTPVMRVATEDIVLAGHSIKKGTNLLFNLHGSHLSEREWGDPLNFRPERFLNADGTDINTDVAHRLLNFGAGRRFCVGQSVAEISLFIYFTRILRKYKFVKVPGTNPTTDPVLGITYSPTPFQAKVVLRS